MFSPSSTLSTPSTNHLASEAIRTTPPMSHELDELVACVVMALHRQSDRTLRSKVVWVAAAAEIEAELNLAILGPSVDWGKVWDDALLKRAPDLSQGDGSYRGAKVPPAVTVPAPRRARALAVRARVSVARSRHARAPRVRAITNVIIHPSI